MAWNQDAINVTIKAIGQVESNLKYDAINYNDPITVGVAQWYGPRASALLKRIRDADTAGFASVDASLRNDLSNHGDTSWWTGRYLSRSEGNSLKRVFLNNKDVQNQVFADDIDDYIAVARRQGMQPDTHTEGVQFFCTMYHQSPRQALNVLNAIGTVTPSLDQIYRGALNNSVLGRYRTRQQTVYNIIRNGDSSGVDTPPGEPEEDGEGGNAGGGGVSRQGSGVSHISAAGDQLLVHFSDGHKVFAVPTTAGTWLLQEDENSGAPVDPGNDGGTPGESTPTDPPGEGSTVQQALVKWMIDRTGRFRYSQGPDRNDPDRTGAVDCSSLVRAAYKAVAGKVLGVNTVAQYNQGRRIESGGRGQFPTLHQPGDLLYSLRGWSGRSTVDHVEMIVNDTTTIGHGGIPPMGPVQKNIRQHLLVPGVTRWYVQRHV